MLAGISPAQKSAAGYGLLLALVLGLGCWARVAYFPAIPPGLNQDEAASGYEAYALAQTGLDRWGAPWPAYFLSLGSGQSVLLAYLTVPVVKVFGLSIFTTRLVMLVLSLLTLPLLAYCLRPLGRYPALLGTLLLAVVPWHFMLSRWGLDCNLAPFFMLLGCTTLAQALRAPRRRWVIPCLMPFALALYSYGTTVLVLPVFFALVLLLVGLRPLRPQAGSWLLAVGLFLVLAAPFLLFFTENYILGRNLAWTDSLFFSTPLLLATRTSEIASVSWSSTITHNLRFLLNSFDDNTTYNLLPGSKLLLSATLPFTLIALLIGGWKLLKLRGRPALSPATTVLGLFVAWGLASCSLFLLFELNVNRFNHAYLPCIILATWGISRTIDSFGPQVPRRAVRLGALVWLLLEGGLALRTYFHSYAAGPIRESFDASLGDAFAAAKGLRGIQEVRITSTMSLSYLYALFYLRYPPAQFQREMRASVARHDYRVKRLGRYVFTDDSLTPGRPYGYLSRPHEYPNTDQQHREVVFSNADWEVGIMHVAAPGK